MTGCELTSEQKIEEIRKVLELFPKIVEQVLFLITCKLECTEACISYLKRKIKHENDDNVIWNDVPKAKESDVITRSNTLESLTAISSIVSEPTPQKPERDDLLPPVEVANTDSAFSVNKRTGFLRKVRLIISQ